MINLGIYKDVKAELAAAGKSIAEVEDVELEPSLGNGGLGRLAACFLDSLDNTLDMQPMDVESAINTECSNRRSKTDIR